MKANLSRFLSPRSVAVIGGKWAREVAKQCLRSGYDGDLWCVNPHQNSVDGVTAYRSVEDLPYPPDAAFVAVNRFSTPAIAEALAKQGCGGAVCFAAGFDEAGDSELTKQLLTAAGDMPFLGPNCYGYINYLANVPLWPDQHGGKAVKSGVAILTQSGNISINLTMQKRGLPLAFICALGNQAQTGFATLSDALLDNPAVTAIGWLMEGTDDARALEEVMRKAHGKKPLVVLKLGASASGVAAAMSHTAALTGNDEATAAFFRRYGVARVRTLPAFLETLKFLHFSSVLHGRRMVSLSCSGGEAALIADRVEQHRIDMPDFSAADKERIGQVAGNLVVVQNPFDYHTFVWGDFPAMRAIYESVLHCDYDVSLLVLDIPRGDRCENETYLSVAETFFTARQAARVGNVAVLATSLPDTFSESLASLSAASGVCCFAGLEEALEAICAAADIGEAWQQALPPPVCRRPKAALSGRVVCDEYAAKEMLATAGLCVPRGKVVEGADCAQKAAASLSFPLAVKVLGVAHKSDVGGVYLHCDSIEAVGQAIGGMQNLGKRFLIEEMVTGIFAELIVGIRYDEMAGLTMTVGAGGIWTEVLQDVAVVNLPTTEDALRQAVRGLRIAAMWQGGRGRRVVDDAIIVDALMKIAAFGEERISRLVELDINPFMLTAAGEAVVADALLIESA